MTSLLNPPLYRIVVSGWQEVWSCSVQFDAKMKLCDLLERERWTISFIAQSFISFDINQRALLLVELRRTNWFKGSGILKVTKVEVHGMHWFKGSGILKMTKQPSDQSIYTMCSLWLSSNSMGSTHLYVKFKGSGFGILRWRSQMSTDLMCMHYGSGSQFILDVNHRFAFTENGRVRIVCSMTWKVTNPPMEPGNNSMEC